VGGGWVAGPGGFSLPMVSLKVRIIAPVSHSNLHWWTRRASQATRVVRRALIWCEVSSRSNAECGPGSQLTAIEWPGEFLPHQRARMLFTQAAVDVQLSLQRALASTLDVETFVRHADQAHCHILLGEEFAGANRCNDAWACASQALAELEEVS
jgi:hypothetical protein